ncbi:uncharacterized [Tachysurus ichikawai]
MLVQLVHQVHVQRPSASTLLDSETHRQRYRTLASLSGPEVDAQCPVAVSDFSTFVSTAGRHFSMRLFMRLTACGKHPAIVNDDKKDVCAEVIIRRDGVCEDECVHGRPSSQGVYCVLQATLMQQLLSFCHIIVHPSFFRIISSFIILHIITVEQRDDGFQCFCPSGAVPDPSVLKLLLAETSSVLIQRAELSPV